MAQKFVVDIDQLQMLLSALPQSAAEGDIGGRLDEFGIQNLDEAIAASWSAAIPGPASGLSEVDPEMARRVAECASPEDAALLLRELVIESRMRHNLLVHVADGALRFWIDKSAHPSDDISKLIALSSLGDLSSAIDAASRLSHRCMNSALSERDIGKGLRLLISTAARSFAVMAEDDIETESQLRSLRRVAEEPQLSIGVISDANLALNDLAKSQSDLRFKLLESKSELRKMVGEVIERAASDAATLGDHNSRMERVADAALQSGAAMDMRQALDEIIREAKISARRMIDTQQALADKEKRIAEFQAQIEDLQIRLADAVQMIRLDALTGLLNRRGLDEAANREISLAQRSKSVLCLAILDLDNFKSFNDSFGHAVGDEALRYLADTLRKVLRPSDSVARIGGEEFVILLPHADGESSRKVFDRLQASLTRPFGPAANSRRISFSAGIAQWRQPDQLVDLLARADRLMYAAKLSGKSRSCVDEPPGPLQGDSDARLSSRNS